MEKKILIFEDDWNTIKGSFELANLYAFNNELTFVSKMKSQDIPFSDWRDEFLAVFVDITLAKNSKLDGYSIISEIKNKNLFDLGKVVVLTGNSNVEVKLKEKGIDVKKTRVIYKPVSFDVISEELRNIISVH
jgi:hypothetical protein